MSWQEGTNDSPDNDSDRIGKPFRVLAGGIRQCIICEQAFTSLSAAQHSRLPYWPDVR
jgi:hypothetical protein